MKKIVFMLGILLCNAIVHADNPSKRSLSDPTYGVHRSSYFPADISRSNVNLSSGVVSLWGVWVSSAGANSQLTIADNWLAGTSSNVIDTSKTNQQIYIPYEFISSSGVVFTSTCTGCTGGWAAPDLRFIYLRIR